jgi:hypothetical protein
VRLDDSKTAVPDTALHSLYEGAMERYLHELSRLYST